MSDVYKLQYNGMTLAYPDWNGYVGYEHIEMLFNVLLQQTTGGTITAIPLQGPNGTVVTLSNTPDANYELANYSVTGATLVDNTFIINNSDVTVTGVFTKISEEWVNMGSTEYRKAGGGTSTAWYSFTGMPASSALNYFTMIFDAYLTGGSGGAADIFLGNSSNSIIWRMRAHMYKSYPGFVGITSNVTGWTTASGAPSVGSFTQDGVSYRYCSSKFTKGNYARFKIAFDRPNKIGYVYIGGTLLGYVTMNTDPINIKKFGLLSELGRPYEIAALKNIRVSGFNTLARAQAWNG